jgi:ADP-ribose pyrophosphatase
MDPNESPVETIRRELAEETGYFPGQLTELGLIHTCVGYSDERLYLYWADNLQRANPQPDEDETIEIVPLGIDSAIGLLRKGSITDAKTQIGLFWAEDIIKRGRLGLCLIAADSEKLFLKYLAASPIGTCIALTFRKSDKITRQ